jgi:phosphatidylinositol-3-phosphatase
MRDKLRESNKHFAEGVAMSSAVQIESLESRVLMSASASAGKIHRFRHVVIVVEENHSYGDVFGPGAGGVPSTLWPVVPPSQRSIAPYMQSLAKHGALMTNFSGLTHPSLPNYLAMFSGSTQGVTSDVSPSKPLRAPSLGGALIKKGLTFAAYSEDLPSEGSLVDKKGHYTRAHAPWTDFTDVPASANKPFSDFPTKFWKLPRVSYVIPNKSNDMHSASIRTADNWLKDNIGAYAKWAKTHNSLLIVTWDEGRGNNHVPTFFYGADVITGQYSQPFNHFNTLRTIEDMYGLDPLVTKGGDNVPAINQIFA